jgi:hypothetical protein
MRGRAQYFDHFPLIFPLIPVTALDTNICFVQKEGAREKWCSCINFFRQSSGLVYRNGATIIESQEGFVLDQLGNYSELR